ncbi:MAG: DUF1203 domain-containing protein [Acidobacteria bacterium]|nr:DUF1203 domain-containing protein [Acidobacteriota bacterium]
MGFKVVPIPNEIAQEARLSRRAPGFGHPIRAHTTPADGYGPCRSCLRRTREGEHRLLMSYNPYPEPEQVPVVGPIFIHESMCAAYRESGFPEEIRELPMALRGHYADGSLILNVKLGKRSPEEVIEELFGDPKIAFIAIQNLEACCFIARIERG